MIDLHRPQIGEAEIKAVERVLREGQLAQGGEVAAFEEEFSKAIEVKHAVAVANGTAALEIGLIALGLRPGDEVIVPSFTFAATANSVRRLGAVPIFVDIDPKTFCLSPATVEPHIGPRTRAVIAVHLYGHPADMDGLTLLCQHKGLHLIEDAAQGIGSAWRSQHVGSFGAFGTFSFYATKNVTTGEGGMITTADPTLAEAARGLRAHQSRVLDGQLRVGTNSRMTDIAAAIGRAQLSRMPEMQRRRQELAAIYDRELPTSISTPYVAAEATHGYHLYTIRVPERKTLASSLMRRGVGHGIYYREPCHLLPEYRSRSETLPETEAAAEEALSIPIRPDLTAEEQETVISAVREGAGDD